ILRVPQRGRLALQRPRDHPPLVDARLRRGRRPRSAREPVRRLRHDARQDRSLVSQAVAPPARDGHAGRAPGLCSGRLGVGRFVVRLHEGLHALLGQRPLTRGAPVKKVLLGGALIVAALVPSAASGSSGSRIQLALVPVPKPALGAVARPLPLARDSGVMSNAVEASQASGRVTAKQLKRLGRVSGYVLDYGNTFGDSAGIRQIQTEIEQYRTVGEARKGLGFWRRQELNNKSLQKLGLDVSSKKLHPAGIPGPHWVYGG